MAEVQVALVGQLRGGLGFPGALGVVHTTQVGAAGWRCACSVAVVRAKNAPVSWEGGPRGERQAGLTPLTRPGVPTMMCGHLSLSLSCSRCCLMGRPPKKLPTRTFCRAGERQQPAQGSVSGNRLNGCTAPRLSMQLWHRGDHTLLQAETLQVQTLQLQTHSGSERATRQLGRAVGHPATPSPSCMW